MDVLKEIWPNALHGGSRRQGQDLVQAIVLSLVTGDVKGSLGEDVRAAFKYEKADHKGRLPFLGIKPGSVRGSQRTLFSA